LRQRPSFQLGPDTEVISETLEKLGKRHAKYGVKAQYFPYMGQALIHAPEMNEAWIDVYDEISGEIMKVILNCSNNTFAAPPNQSILYAEKFK
jgi:hemoglobin-like flavoprotein